MPTKAFDGGTSLHFKSKWRCCFEPAELEAMSIGYADLKLVMTTAEQGNGIAAQYVVNAKRQVL